jgi:hypothetical protein
MQALIVSKKFGRRSINAPDLYAYVAGNPISFRDPAGEGPAEALIGAAIGGGWGLVTGLIEGERGYDLMNHILEDASIGGLTGLTDGLNLIAAPGLNLAARAGLNAAISGIGEAYKEEVSYMSTGCPKEFSGNKIALSALSGATGSLFGSALSSAASLSYAAKFHALYEDPEVLSAFFGSNIEGALSTIVPIVEISVMH